MIESRCIAVVGSLLSLLALDVCWPGDGTPGDAALPPREAGLLLLQSPTLSATEIAFAYADDIWIVPRNGGMAHRLVSDGDIASRPIFSPDGSMVAYTANHDGNFDVYVVPATGGNPRRLTYHPGEDVAVGWTPDGQNILFRSTRSNFVDVDQLFTVSIGGVGLPVKLPLPTGVEGSFSQDGAEFAYVPHWNRRPGAAEVLNAIKRYRGGLASPIWITRLSDSSVTPIPRDNSNDFAPMWVGTTVYFLSDRRGLTTLFAYDATSRAVRQLINIDNGRDIKSASAGPGGIVYEQLGAIGLYDLSTGNAHVVPIKLEGDMPQTRPHIDKMSLDDIVDVGISPSGARAVLEAHGEIFTAPAEKGDIRNITRSPAVADRSPAWSPDGRSIAYFSDDSGEYRLHISDQSGRGPVTVIDLGSPPSFFYLPKWSPDNRKIAYSDKRLNLWYVDLDRKAPIKIATNRYDVPGDHFDFAWSPDSRWLAYDKQLTNHLHALFVYSVEEGLSRRLTDGLSDATLPQFDRNGQLLYFAASTDAGLSAAWLDMTSELERPTRNVYAIVLPKDQRSPLAPQSDEEKPVERAVSDAFTDHQRPSTRSGTPRTVIDFDDIDQRIIGLPVPADDIVALWCGHEQDLYIVSQDEPSNATGKHLAHVRRFDFKIRKTEELLDRVDRFALSENGEKILYQKDGSLFIVAAGKVPRPGEGAINLAELELRVDPPAEWRQMYQEVWRIERDFFYDPHFHGLDLVAAERAYAPYLAGIASRSDLNYLFQDMLGNLNVLHLFVGGGSHRRTDAVNVGLLAADYAVDHDRYRITRIYRGENWYPMFHSPLTEPGVNIREGEYVLAVNGRPLHGTDNIYSFFQETAGRQVVLTVGPNPDEVNSREVTVVPIATEMPLRLLSWIDGNRRKVQELTHGRLAYIYLPDTGVRGFANFNRRYFAQVGEEGAIIDERFNSGGLLPDYIIDYLRRPVLSYVTTRSGEDFVSPGAAIYGPKAMIINEFAASGGDALAWYFREAKIGPLIGTRTWGGGCGIWDYPVLLDGGWVTAPREALYGPDGQWAIENRGVSPDYEVEQDPRAVRNGQDPQLEKAIAIAMDELRQHPPPTPKRPPYANFRPQLPTTAR